MATSRGGYARGRETRQRIIDEASTLFGEVGFRAASLREIGARCGTSHAALLYHFPSKEELLTAVLEQRDRESAATFAAEDASGAELLDRFLQLLRRNSEEPDIIALFATLSAEASAPDHPAHEYFVRRYDRLRAALGAAFEQLQARGRVRPGVDPRQLAVATIAMLDGLQVQWLLNNEAIDMPAEMQAFLSLAVPDWKPSAGEATR